MNLRMLNVTFEYILCNKIMYFGDFVVLVPYISNIMNKHDAEVFMHEYLMVFI